VVAPKPVPLPGLEVPLLPFSKGMWLAVCIYFVFATLILYGVSKTTDRLLGKHHYYYFTRFYNPLAGFSLLSLDVARSHSDTTQSVGLLWTSDQHVAETST
jgi:hypothetical protein